MVVAARTSRGPGPGELAVRAWDPLLGSVMTRHGTSTLRWRHHSLLVTIALAASACAHWPGARGRADEEVRAAVAAANTEFARALVAGDAPAMAAVFTEDGEIVPAMQDGFVSGRAAIEAHYARLMTTRRYLDVVITTARLSRSGDLAWETGTNRMTLKQGESAPVTVTGRYLAVWRREPDGRWRICAELPIADASP